MSAPGRNALLVAGALILAVGAFLVLKPGDDDESSIVTTTATVTLPAKTSTATTSPAVTTAPQPTVKVIRTRGGEAVGGVQKVEANKDAMVRIDVTSDVEEQVHLHGYDLEERIPAGGRARLRFKADIAGRFEIELHESGRQIGDLTVNP